MQPRYKECPDCGLTVEVDQESCERCGHRFRTQFTTRRDQTQLLQPEFVPPDVASPRRAPQAVRLTDLHAAAEVSPVDGPIPTIAKWAAISWSAVCVVGVLMRLLRGGTDASNPNSQASLALNLFIWLVVWVAIAGPAALAYFLTRGRR